MDTHNRVTKFYHCIVNIPPALLPVFKQTLFYICTGTLKRTKPGQICYSTHGGRFISFQVHTPSSMSAVLSPPPSSDNCIRHKLSQICIVCKKASIVVCFADANTQPCRGKKICVLLFKRCLSD